MIRFPVVSLLIVLMVLSAAHAAQAATQLYTGRMEILVTSGKACEGLARTHDVSLALKVDEHGSTAQSGYFAGGGITIGKFSGKDLSRLDVRYPFHDEQRATGHVLSITRSETSLAAELRDRHIDPDSDDCNFDLARMELTRKLDGDADALLVQLAGQFDTQMTRSEAVALAQSSGYAAALPYFEKALVLADTFLPKGSDQINSYIMGLATSYIWLERFDEFNQLFDTRIITIKDETIRSVFSGYRIRFLMNAGRAALGREEYDTALMNFEQAHKLQPQNREAISAVLTVYVRNGRYAESVSFLERAELMLESEVDRKDIRAAAAMVLFKKAQKDDENGHGQEAESALKRAMELDAGSVHYLVALARLRHKAGHLDEAETLLAQGLERFSDTPSRDALIAARDKMRQTEMFLRKIRKADS